MADISISLINFQGLFVYSNFGRYFLLLGIPKVLTAANIYTLIQVILMFNGFALVPLLGCKFIQKYLAWILNYMKS